MKVDPQGRLELSKIIDEALERGHFSNNRPDFSAFVFYAWNGCTGADTDFRPARDVMRDIADMRDMPTPPMA
jgi:hypothetical protein